jgi:hypothetical protein
MCEFHSLSTTSEHCPRALTRSQPMGGTPLFSNLEDTCANKGLTEITHGQPRKTDAQQASRRN